MKPNHLTLIVQETPLWSRGKMRGDCNVEIMYEKGYVAIYALLPFLVTTKGAPIIATKHSREKNTFFLSYCKVILVTKCSYML